eukprot:gene1795-1825_t
MPGLTWNNQSITAKYWYPKLGVEYTDQNLGETMLNADGSQFLSPSGFFDYSITQVSATQEKLTVTYINGGFADALFNGPVFLGPATDLPIVSATLLSSPVSGFTQANIGHNNNSVWLNDANLNFSSGSSVSVLVSFDPGPSFGNLTVFGPPQTPLDVTFLVKMAIIPGVPTDTTTITGAGPGAVYNPANSHITYTSAAGVTHDTLTVTYADQYGDTGTGLVKVQVGHDNTTVHLNGSNNVVDAQAVDLQGSSNAGAAINGPYTGGTTLQGTKYSETITAYGTGSTILGNGGSDTIYAGSGAAHVTVSDIDGDNTVTGLVSNSSVTLGDGNNTISMGGYTDTVSLGNGNNTVNAGAGSDTVTVGNGINNVTFSGFGNTLNLGIGTATADIGYGSDHVTIRAGNNTLTAHGFNDVFDIDGGTTTISGIAGLDTINVGQDFGIYDSIDLAGGAGYLIKYVSGNMVVTKPDGELIATVKPPTGKTLKAVADGAGGTKIVLSAATVPTPTPTPNPTPNPTPTPTPAPTVITETTWGVTLVLADATKTVHLAGYNNTVTGGDGDHFIDGDNGGLKLTLGSGNNVVKGNGFNNVINLGVDAQGHFTGTGNNTVSGTLGTATIHTAAGNQNINAFGYTNTITTGAGNSTVIAGAGADFVDVGSGTNTVTADGNTNTIITHLGENTVKLNGWTNLIEAGAGHTIVFGGYQTTYQVLATGSAGGLEAVNFSTVFGDVLDLHPIVGTGHVTVQNGSSGDLKVFLTPTGGSAIQVADLHGMAGETVASLMAKHALTLRFAVRTGQFASCRRTSGSGSVVRIQGLESWRLT